MFRTLLVRRVLSTVLVLGAVSPAVLSGQIVIKKREGNPVRVEPQAPRDSRPKLLLTSPQALSFGWGGFAETNLGMGTFFNDDFTLIVRFLPEFLYSYAGPIVAAAHDDSSSAFSVGMGDYRWGDDHFFGAAKPEEGEAGEPKMYLVVGGQRRVFGIESKLQYANVPRPPFSSKGAGAKAKFVRSKALAWQHLAVVRQSNVFRVYLNGELLHDINKESPITVSGISYGDGIRLRLGRATALGVVDKFITYEAQYYGLIDDLVVYDVAYSAQQVLSHAEEHESSSVNVREGGVLRGWNFEGGDDGPIRLRGDAARVEVTADRRALIDAKGFDEHAPSVPMDLPFKEGEAWLVVQGYGDGTLSHNSFATFSLDFVRAPAESVSSKGAGFLAAAPGSVVKVADDEPDGNGGAAPANFVAIKQADGEYTVYMHNEQHSYRQTQKLRNRPLLPKPVDASDSNDTITTSDRKVVPLRPSLGSVERLQPLARVGDTGVNKGGYHLHLAISNRITSNGFATFPVAFNNYEVSDDEGLTWQKVKLGTPKAGQWVRRMK